MKNIVIIGGILLLASVADSQERGPFHRIGRFLFNVGGKPIKPISKLEDKGARPANRHNRSENYLATHYNYVDPGDDNYYLVVYQNAVLANENDRAEEIRNEIIYEWLTIVDEFYYNQQLSRRSYGFLVQTLPQALSIASSLSTINSTKTILSQVSAGLQGVKKGGDGYWLSKLEETSLAQIRFHSSEMRREIYEEIRAKMVKKSDVGPGFEANPVEKYSLAEAERDILRYWNAGTALSGMKRRDKTVQEEQTRVEGEVMRLQKAGAGGE